MSKRQPPSLDRETYKSGSTVVAESSFTYDLTGNRLSQTVDGVTTGYTYNELDQMLTAGSVQYEYDDRGNLKKEIDGSQIAQYNYDAADRLASVITPDGTTITNSYDADGRRVEQTVNAQVTTYLWDESTCIAFYPLRQAAGAREFVREGGDSPNF
jgi:YD repeat-containing protein